MNADWVAPGRTALLLIDMQVDFAAADGASARLGHDMTAVHKAVARAALLADAARAAHVSCIFVRLITRPGGESAALRTWQARRGHDKDAPLCAEGTPGAAFVGPQPLAGETIITKTRYSAFTGTGLAEHLRGLGVDTLVLAGLTTECCIDTSARDAFEQDFLVVIAADAVAAYDLALHGAALRALETNLATLCNTDVLINFWKYLL